MREGDGGNRMNGIRTGVMVDAELSGTDIFILIKKWKVGGRRAGQSGFLARAWSVCATETVGRGYF